MTGHRNKRWRLRRATIPALCLAAIAYFGYHAIYGSYGLLAYGEAKERGARLQDRLDRLVAQRVQLDAKVALMRPDSLDPDMLEEQARKALGYAHPDDLIILTDD